MNQKFQASVQEREDVTYIKLAGVIDEDNELAMIGEKISANTAVIDLSEIERINSCGVRDWVNWLGKAEKGGAKIVMVECSPPIVAQINLVSNFTGQGVVKSFYAPYFCPRCDIEKVLLIETRDLAGGAAPFKAPSCRCDECDGPMDFDDMEESYFAFLANAAKIVTDSRVESVLAEFTPTDGEKKIKNRDTNPGSKGGAGGQTSGVHQGSLPSIPSLPTRTPTPPPAPGSSSMVGSFGISGLHDKSNPGSMSGVHMLDSSRSGIRPSAAAALAELEARRQQSAPVPLAPQKTHPVVYIIIVAILASLALLGYVLFGKH